MSERDARIPELGACEKATQSAIHALLVLLYPIIIVIVTDPVRTL